MQQCIFNTTIVLFCWWAFSCSGGASIRETWRCCRTSVFTLADQSDRWRGDISARPSAAGRSRCVITSPEQVFFFGRGIYLDSSRLQDEGVIRCDCVKVLFKAVSGQSFPAGINIRSYEWRKNGTLLWIQNKNPSVSTEPLGHCQSSWRGPQTHSAGDDGPRTKRERAGVFWRGL